MGVPIRLGGGWDSPRRGVRDGTGVYAGLGCPAWAGRGLGISSTMVDGVRNGTGIYTGLGWGSSVLVGVPLGSWDSPGQLFSSEVKSNLLVKSLQT